MNAALRLLEPSPSRGGLGGDGVALSPQILAAASCMNTIPTQTLPLKGRASGLDIGDVP